MAKKKKTKTCAKTRADKPQPIDSAGHVTPRTSVNIPTVYAEAGKKAAKKHEMTFVKFLCALIDMSPALMQK